MAEVWELRHVFQRTAGISTALSHQRQFGRHILNVGRGFRFLPQNRTHAHHSTLSVSLCDGPFRAVLSGELESSPVTDYYRTNSGDWAHRTKEKISNKSMAKDRHRVSCGFFHVLFFELPGPNLELYDRDSWVSMAINGTKPGFWKLTRESQDPVHRLIPSLLTPKQLTRFS